MNITIISVGKIKEKYIKLGIEEFSKRLSRYCKLILLEQVYRAYRINNNEPYHK